MSDQKYGCLDEKTNMDDKQTKVEEDLIASKDDTSNKGALSDLDSANLGIVNQTSTQDNTDRLNQRTNTDSIPLNSSASIFHVLETPSSLDQVLETPSSLNQVLENPSHLDQVLETPAPLVKVFETPSFLDQVNPSPLDQVLETPSSQVSQTDERQMTGKQYSAVLFEFIRQMLGIGDNNKLPAEYRPDGLRKKVKTHVIGFTYEKLKSWLNLYFRNKNLEFMPLDQDFIKKISISHTRSFLSMTVRELLEEHAKGAGKQNNRKHMKKLSSLCNSDIDDFLSSKVRNVIINDYLPNQLEEDLKELKKKEYEEVYVVIFQYFAEGFVEYFEQCGPNKVNLERLSQLSMESEGNYVSIGSTDIQTLDQEMEKEIEQMPEEESQQETILCPQRGELRVVSDKEIHEILSERLFAEHQNAYILDFLVRDVQMNSNEEEIEPIERVSPSPRLSDYLQFGFFNNCLAFEEPHFPTMKDFQLN